MLGGQVRRFSSPIMRTQHLQITPQGLALLERLNLNPQTFSGPVPAFHYDYILPSIHTTPVFSADTPQGKINYGAMHDAGALTVQYHPEYWWVESLLTSVRTGRRLELVSSAETSIATLRLFAQFISAHSTLQDLLFSPGTASEHVRS